MVEKNKMPTRKLNIAQHVHTNVIQKIIFLSYFLSSANLKVASKIDNVNTGYKRLIVEITMSAKPYSSVVRILVYTGNNTNVNILEPKLLTANSPVSVRSFLYRSYLFATPL